VCTDELPPVAAASMWTRKDVKEFKESLKNDHESVLKVGSGEIVTVSELFIRSSVLCHFCVFRPSVQTLLLQRPDCASQPQPQCSWCVSEIRENKQRPCPVSERLATQKFSAYGLSS